MYTKGTHSPWLLLIDTLDWHLNQCQYSTDIPMCVNQLIYIDQKLVNSLLTVLSTKMSIENQGVNGVSIEYQSSVNSRYSSRILIDTQPHDPTLLIL